MKIYNIPVEVIIDVPAAGAFAKTAKQTSLQAQLEKAGIPVDKLIEKNYQSPSLKKSMATTAGTKKIYVKTKVTDAEINPWDVAHQATDTFKTTKPYAEPDNYHEFPADSNEDSGFKKSKKPAAAKGAKVAKPTDDSGFDPDWPPNKNIIWHLDNNYSQLLSARNAVAGENYNIRIAHIDTGYDPTHTIIPDSVRQNKLQRNFVDGENKNIASDPRAGGLLRMPGHGTGTFGILAGAKMKFNTDTGVFNDFVGGIPFAEVVCCRIAKSVILLKSSAFAEALNYIVSLGQQGKAVQVVTMSMGGAPSKAWADAVNAAYDAGIFMVSAAGNNFNGLPTQRVIYPARFKRVVAACGVTQQLKPYHTSKLGEMQGCFGPEKHMTMALSAFTPNVPWAVGSASTVSFSGAGTSCATPQIAAAAGLYYRKHHQVLDQLAPWQRVEAIRYALFTSASKVGNPGSDAFKFAFGNGILKASDALNVPVHVASNPQPVDKCPWFPILSTMLKAVPKESTSNKLQMYNMELNQLAFNYPELNRIIGDDEPGSRTAPKKWKQFTEAVIAHPASSRALKQYLMKK